jgi:Family of unknown function (DUF6410)
MMPTATHFTIGLDSTTFGRWVRVLLGLLFILYAGLRMISISERADARAVLVSFLSILVVYYVAYLALEHLLLARQNPWLNTLVFVVPALVIVFAPLFPSGLQVGMVLYWGVSLLLNALIGYGGCEVLAIPTLIYKRRYDVYCPTNVLDLAERAVVRTQGKARGSTGNGDERARP